MTSIRKKRNRQTKPVAVDLFSGGGGLTVGLERAGFQVVAAVEIDEHSVKTFSANHPDVKLFHRDVRLVTGAELIACSRTGRVDLLAGCPPCQGFSSLTSKYKKTDPRNVLIREMGRLVKEILTLSTAREIEQRVREKLTEVAPDVLTQPAGGQ